MMIMVCDVKDGCKEEMTPRLSEKTLLVDGVFLLTWSCSKCNALITKALEIRECQQLMEERVKLSKNFAVQMRTLELSKASEKVIKRAQKVYKNKQDAIKNKQNAIYQQYKLKYKEHLEG